MMIIASNWQKTWKDPTTLMLVCLLYALLPTVKNTHELFEQTSGALKMKRHLRYIAASAPLPNTIESWYRMIWELDIVIIVMLTQCMEGNKVPPPPSLPFLSFSPVVLIVH